jgi:hypothetical protein
MKHCLAVAVFLSITVAALLVGGCTYYGHQFVMTPEARTKHGKYDVVLWAWAYGPENLRKHQHHRKFELILSIALNGKSLLSEPAEVALIDKLYNVDYFLETIS